MPAGRSVEAYWRAGRGSRRRRASDRGRRGPPEPADVRRGLLHVDLQDRPPYSAISTVTIGALVAAGFRKRRRLPGATCAGRTSARV